MSFRANLKRAHLLRWSFFILPFALSSCNAKFGEKGIGDGQKKFSEMTCITDAFPVVKKFIQGESETSEILATFGCFHTALEKFQRYVVGRHQNQYTPAELTNFIQSNFTLDSAHEVPADLQDEYMKFKQLFTGGSRDFLTAAELTNLIELLQPLQSIALRLNPYMKVLMGTWVHSKDPVKSEVDFFEAANLEFQNSAVEFYSLLNAGGPPYVIRDVGVLISKMSSFFGENWPWLPDLQRVFPLLEKVKLTLAGGNEHQVSAQEWKSLLLLGARGYFQWLRYSYFIQTPEQLTSTDRFSFVTKTFEEICTIFAQLVQMKPGAMIHIDEVNGLLEEFSKFYPSFKISSGIVKELMKVKRLFFGGDLLRFTQKDFETAKLKITNLHEFFIDLIPFYSVYALGWKLNPDTYEENLAQYARARSKLIKNLAFLGSLTEGTYDFKDLGKLLGEVRKLYAIQDFSIYFPLLIQIKNIVGDSDDSVIRPNNWVALAKTFSNFYSLYLYYYYFFESVLLPVEEPSKLRAWSDGLKVAQSSLIDFVGLLKSKSLTSAQVYGLVLEAQKLTWLPAKLRAESIHQLVDLSLNRLLTPPETRLGSNRFISAKDRGLDELSINTIYQELKIWIELELQIYGIFKFRNSDDRLSLATVRQIYSDTLKTVGISDLLKKGLQESLLQLNTTVPMAVDLSDRLMIQWTPEAAFSKRSLNFLNRDRLLARLLVRSAGDELGRVQNYFGILQSEGQVLFDQVFPAALDLGLFHPSDASFIEKRFLEANLFTPHANGDNLASFQELTDLISMIFSGLKNADFLTPALVERCSAVSGVMLTENSLDSSDWSNLELQNLGTTSQPDFVVNDCTKAYYTSKLPFSLLGLPEFMSFAKKLPASDWPNFIENLIKAAGAYPDNKGNILLADVSLVTHVTQYIEMLYHRFDGNRDGMIQANEAIEAFPAFRELLKTVAAKEIKEGLIKEADLLPLFTYILKYGKAPETIKEVLGQWLPWKWTRPSDWSIAATRAQVAGVLGYISDRVRKTNPSIRWIPNSSTSK